MVYLLADKDIPLYVGRSRTGLGRPFQPSHAALEVPASRWARLYVWTVESEAAALRLERQLLRSLYPLRNVAGLPGRVEPDEHVEPGWEASDWSGPHDHRCDCGAVEACEDRTCARALSYDCASCHSGPGVRR